ncbi:unnamed protein product [Amoebophrya sp. A25]|nr:unnamed protein product [Amoebophrya sp. A25]|eukprot:GSA25T00010650001.1
MKTTGQLSLLSSLSALRDVVVGREHKSEATRRYELQQSRLPSRYATSSTILQQYINAVSRARTKVTECARQNGVATSLTGVFWSPFMLFLLLLLTGSNMLLLRAYLLLNLGMGLSFYLGQSASSASTFGGRENYSYSFGIGGPPPVAVPADLPNRVDLGPGSRTTSR